MKWPTGRYNGMRIVGVDIRFQIDVTEWLWRPMIGHRCGALHWGCVRSWWQLCYERFPRGD
jgi:hypothetical protein